MKKQILFLMFFTLTAMFSVNQADAQLAGGIDTPTIADGSPDPYTDYLTAASPAVATVTALACAPEAGPLSPQVGETYTYTVNVSEDTAAGGPFIHWFVTDNVNVLAAINDLTGTGVDPNDGSAYIMAAGTEYNDAGNESNTIGISWNAIPSTQTLPILLVTYVLDEAGCTDNIQVYNIQPIFKFSLDIAAYNEADGSVITDGSAEECVSPVESAIWNTTTNALEVDYGENWVFFSVTAAYFSHSWMPSFQVSYDGTVSDPISVEWALLSESGSGGTWHSTTATTTGTGTETYTSTDPVLVQSATGTDTGAGESIVVRVRVDHGTTENGFNNINTINLGVNGIMYNGTDYSDTTLADLGPDGDSDGNCDQIDYDDNTDYTITPRPLVESATDDLQGGVAPFESVNP